MECMVSGLAQNKMIELAKKYFHILPYKDIAAWSAMITAYVDEEQVDEVRDLFIGIMQVSITLNEHDWLKIGTTGSYSTIFADTFWWAQCHRNHMCLNNENWPIKCISSNIHNMVGTLTF